MSGAESDEAPGLAHERVGLVAVRRVAAASARPAADDAGSGVSPLMFALLTLLAVAAGAATGMSGAASRLWRSLGFDTQPAVGRSRAQRGHPTTASARRRRAR